MDTKKSDLYSQEIYITMEDKELVSLWYDYDSAFIK